MKNVLITGASGGIGNSIVHLFHKKGYNIFATGTNISKLDVLEKTYTERIKCFKCDLKDFSQIEEMTLCAKQYYGKTDILINNAGIAKDNLFIRMKDDEWNDVINVNLNANFKITKIILKEMVKAKWGRVINISSDAAKIGNLGQANYVASKSAIEGITRTLANEVATRGVTVNCIAPGFIETEILKSIDEKRLNIMKEKIPLGRIGKANEVASVVYFLSSEESSYITGQVFHVNGGLTM